MADCKVKSEIAGSVWKIERCVGDEIAAGDAIIILESMKMEIPVASPVAGRIQSIRVDEGDMVAEEQLVAVIVF